MNKEELISKLAGNSLQEYLVACNYLPNYVASGGSLDQAIIERALYVNLLPLWALHDDLEEKLSQITNEIPNHSALLNDTDLKEHLTGLSLFVNGFINGEFDLSGFTWCSNGFLCANSACETIATHYKAEGKTESFTYFNDLAEWFLEIYASTTAVFAAVMEIDSWNEEMLVGLTNFLNQSLNNYGVFEWILSGLYKVVEDPLVKEKVFNHYINVFKKSSDNFKEEGNQEAVDDIDEKLKRLRKLANGESV